MTASSPARKERRVDGHNHFPLPPDGMLSERIDLIPYGLVLGLVHPEGSPMLVVAWDGEKFKRMLPEQASQWADDLIAAGHAVTLAPVIEAVRKLVRRVGEIITESIMRQSSLSEMEVEGHA